jgi:hypothetical protein
LYISLDPTGSESNPDPGLMAAEIAILLNPLARSFFHKMKRSPRSVSRASFPDKLVI